MVLLSLTMKTRIFILYLVAIIIGSWGIHQLFEYKPKSNIQIANIIGVDSAEIISFYYSEDWNIKDYDIVESYILSKKTIKRFQEKSSLVLYDESYESSWGKINWCKTPIDLTKWNSIYEMAIIPYRENSMHNKWIKEIQKFLNTPDNFYSFYYKKNGSAIALFILSTNEDKLYCLYYKI